ncbi:uncharacterized protein LOC114522503 isoform X2 [Dendronephthya gigantea]|uniref:uncharacterized protein LOC114522503 isoform X2 n=1 Tax=Dendronephthya gigantea TaxID=151771 RepID=UPI001069F7FB|nr:uncharacterized protein LOC114522503 isoform X2 [Dendronephthya gigantea]
MLFLFCDIIVLFVWITIVTPTKHSATIAIQPNQLYCNLKLTSGESALYHLTKLQRNTGYEFRISYPAVTPTDFVIKDLNITAATGRKLLSIEKFVFWTDMREDRHVEVTAIHTGRVPNNSDLKDLTVTYDVVVEQLYAGVPMSAWKLVLFISVTMFIVLKFCRQPFINYINSDDEKLE